MDNRAKITATAARETGRGRGALSSFIDRRRGNPALQGRGEWPLLLFGLRFRIGPENLPVSEGKNQALRRCSFGGGTLRDCAWRAYKTEDDMGLLRQRPVKREPTCSAWRLYSLYSGIPTLQGREDVNSLPQVLPDGRRMRTSRRQALVQAAAGREPLLEELRALCRVHEVHPAATVAPGNDQGPGVLRRERRVESEELGRQVGHLRRGHRGAAELQAPAARDVAFDLVAVGVHVHHGA